MGKERKQQRNEKSEDILMGVSFSDEITWSD